MAYDANKIAQKIIEAKNGWASAYSKGDQQKANEIAQNARQYYDQLIQNGDKALASGLEARDNTQAPEFVNQYMATKDKNAIRPYLYGKAQKYGLSTDDVDKALSFDETTGQVSLNGKNIGTPYSIVDGVSYWDSKTLDNAWDDYVNSSGLTRQSKDYVSQENENISNKMNKLYDMSIEDSNDVINEIKKNPYTSDVGKSILAGYNLQGLQAGYNAAGSVAANNGGNIDSFAAANAMRQQAALTNQGRQAVLDYYNSYVGNLSAETDNKLNRARNILSDLGVNVDRVWGQTKDQFDMDETAKNNDVSRNAAIAEITGYVPNQWLVKDNPYFDENGNLIDPNMDYQAIMETAKANGDDRTYLNASAARIAKIRSYPEYRKYLGDDPLMTPGLEINSNRESAKDRQSSKEITQMGLDSDYAINKMNNETAQKQIDAEAAATQSQIAADLEARNNETAAGLEASKYTADSNTAQAQIQANSEKYAIDKQLESDSVNIQNEQVNGKFKVGNKELTIDEISEGLNNGTIQKIQYDNNKVYFVDMEDPSPYSYLPKDFNELIG